MGVGLGPRLALAEQRSRDAVAHAHAVAAVGLDRPAGRPAAELVLAAGLVRGLALVEREDLVDACGEVVFDRLELDLFEGEVDHLTGDLVGGVAPNLRAELAVGGAVEGRNQSLAEQLEVLIASVACVDIDDLGFAEIVEQRAGAGLGVDVLIDRAGVEREGAKGQGGKLEKTSCHHLGRDDRAAKGSCELVPQVERELTALVRSPCGLDATMNTSSTSITLV